MFCLILSIVSDEWWALIVLLSIKILSFETTGMAAVLFLYGIQAWFPGLPKSFVYQNYNKSFSA